MSGVDAGELAVNLLKEQCTDADKWATAFVAMTWEKNMVRIDQDYARAWFANAMMTMHDSIHNKKGERE